MTPNCDSTSVERSTAKGLPKLLDTRLPLNRKEAFFTATVLPAIICADGFKHFDRFLGLLGLTAVAVDASRENANIQFFTEYCLAEAIIDERAIARFPGAPRDRERPDLMILVEGSEPLLVAIEAKLYASIQAADLNRQMANQEKHVLGFLRECWPGLRTIHAALLPRSLRQRIEAYGPSLTITWEDILDKYEGVESARYFHEILKIALRDYERLKARTSPTNGDGHLTGEEILRRYQERRLEFQTMGRHGGLEGEQLRDDVTSDRWRRQRYWVRKSPRPTTNWFPIFRIR